MAQLHSEFGLSNSRLPHLPGTLAFDSASNPALVASEPVRDTAAVESVEVAVFWGDYVLHIAHLTPARSYRIGEGAANEAVDFEVPRGKLGVLWHDLISIDGGEVYVLVPGGCAWSSSAAEHRGATEPGAAMKLCLLGKDTVNVVCGDLRLQVSSVARARALPKSALGTDASTIASYFGLSMLAVGTVAGALAYASPAFGLVDDEGLSSERLYLIQQYLSAAAERDKMVEETDSVRSDSDMGENGNVRDTARGESGAMGKASAEKVAHRAGVRGPADNRNPALPNRSEMLKEAQSFGMLGILGSSDFRNAPTVAWGSYAAEGTDEHDAMGNMFGPTLGDAFGAGGLTLSGIGEGGGGRGDQIGMRGVRTCAGALCSGNGGYGHGSAFARRGHKTSVPPLRFANPIVSGRLPPEVIQRVVRQNYGRFRMCYERGLARNPNLEGRVSVRFAIDRDGRVAAVSNGGSDLPDSAVVGCVVNAYYGLSFPQPEGGTVTVSYPIMFAPG